MSTGSYKQCPNGHYYQGDHCPYCNPGTSDPGGKTISYQDEAEETTLHTEAGQNNSGRTVAKETYAGALQAGPVYPSPRPEPSYNGGGSPSNNLTCFPDDETEIISTPSGRREQPVYRETRKLVGWLVSYTIDTLGVDFKLYEGRNIIGRDMDCNITVNDKMVSSRHAVLLFRAGKYSITDSQSSHGTFVNDRDIELDPCYLSDGDIIQVGQTVFKFRSSL